MKLSYKFKSIKQHDLLIYSLLTIVILTTALFLSIYLIWVPFPPAIIVHIIYLTFNVLLMFFVSKKNFFVKVSLLASNLIQLSFATFLWFPLSTNYDLFYFLLPMGAFSLMNLQIIREKIIAFIISFISLLFFFLNRFMGINFYIYELNDTPEKILSFFTITSTMCILILYFYLHAYFLSQQRVELEYLANTDTLTNIPNRRRFYNLSQLEFELAHRYKHTFTLLLLDIDHFKSINDTHGHSIGDEVLKQLTTRVKDNVRSHDIFARYGGEEFTLLLRQTDATSGLKIAEKIRKTVEQMGIITVAGKLNITISIGMVQFNPKYNTLESLIQLADKALYEAKEKGRNCIVYKSTDDF